ncbi:DUF3817 domain-containing protein [Hoyosella rhizosphaerae]|nr:DUF3817 domain-containing protein [Hoyosella rhizosphaerae]MBN4927376.1 DUF3817 domain-containing protein [Hoyosella rhizosphaerae]
MLSHGYMHDFFNLSTPAKRFRFVAVVEAFTWAGLLVGMYFKHVAKTTEVGVQVFGALHGAAFMVFVLVTLLTARQLSWNWRVTGLALASSIPPLTTVPFEIWSARKGHLAELSEAVQQNADSSDVRSTV